MSTLTWNDWTEEGPSVSARETVDGRVRITLEHNPHEDRYEVYVNGDALDEMRDSRPIDDAKQRATALAEEHIARETAAGQAQGPARTLYAIIEWGEGPREENNPVLIIGTDEDELWRKAEEIIGEPVDESTSFVTTLQSEDVIDLRDTRVEA